MSNHLLLMSFDASSLANLFTALSRFLEYTIAIVEDKPQINFCYIGTASNDRFIDLFFYQCFMAFKFGKRVKTSYLSISNLSEQEIEKHLLAQDIVFIGGGNTEKMLEIWRNKGMISVLNKLKKENKLPILAGVSAGGMYPFHSGLSDSRAGQYIVLPCMQWFKQSFCAHSNSAAKKLCIFDDGKFHDRLSAYQAAVNAELLPPGYAIPDQSMLHIYDGELISAFSTNAGNPCFYIGTNSREEIETHFLHKTNVLEKVMQALLKIGVLRSRK